VYCVFLVFQAKTGGRVVMSVRLARRQRGKLVARVVAFGTPAASLFDSLLRYLPKTIKLEAINGYC